MGKYDGYLLLSDFDGTLAHTEYAITGENKTAKKAISQENCEAIRYFQSEGGLFTLATGRLFSWVEQWTDFILPNTYIASLNGAYICDLSGKDLLFSQPMDPDFVLQAERIRAACPDLEWVHFHSINKSLMVKKGEKIDFSEFLHPVYKMVFYAHKEQSDEYAQKIASLLDDRYVSMRSWINGIEVQMRGAGKGESIARFKQALGERARVVVAVGDYENDVDMIRKADIGYAVANAVPALKEVADRITVSANESALAKIIAELPKIQG